MRSLPGRPLNLAVALFAILLLSGCGAPSTYTLALRPYQPSEGPYLDLQVVVALPEEIYEFSGQSGMGAKTLDGLGTALVQGSERLAASVFRQTTVLTPTSLEKIPPGTDALLSARIASFTETPYNFVVGSVTTRLILEWTLQRPTGEVIWRDRVMGEGTTQGRGSSHQAVEQRMQSMLDDLFARSRQRIKEAEAVRAAATRKETAGIRKDASP
jgi:hypothetical protein